MWRAVLLPVSCICCVIATGCAEATIASAGAIAGLAASTVSTGADVYGMGKLNAVDMVTFSEQVDSVRKTAADLKLTIESEEYYEPGRWRCRIVDERDTHFRVYIDRRSAKICRTKIDMGIFGSEPTARLFIARMRLFEPAVDAATQPTTRAKAKQRLGIND